MMRETEIDQIWYTWSPVGLSGTTAGYRVRAASEGFGDLRGERFAAIDRYLRYMLPRGINPNSVSPADAPVCLALVNVGEERILVHKVYTGRDAFGRPGNYFTHLLAGIPATFTARDAIRLWDSSLWQNEDLPLEKAPTTLKTLSSQKLDDYVQQSQLTFDFTRLKAHLYFLIKAFLVPARQQRPLYIVGRPQDVAALIWGLTHSLPAQLLPAFTFSTYEHDISACHETITGTVTSSALPTAYSNGDALTLNCELSPPDLPAYDEDREAFLAFAMQHLTQQDGHEAAAANPLFELIRQAEAKEAHITTLKEFITFFQRQSRQTPERLISGLTGAIQQEDWASAGSLCHTFATSFPPSTHRDAWLLLLQSFSRLMRDSSQQPPSNIARLVLQDESSFIAALRSLLEGSREEGDQALSFLQALGNQPLQKQFCLPLSTIPGLAPERAEQLLAIAMPEIAERQRTLALRENNVTLKEKELIAQRRQFSEQEHYLATRAQHISRQENELTARLHLASQKERELKALARREAEQGNQPVSMQQSIQPARNPKQPEAYQPTLSAASPQTWQQWQASRSINFLSALRLFLAIDILLLLISVGLTIFALASRPSSPPPSKPLPPYAFQMIQMSNSPIIAKNGGQQFFVFLAVRNSGATTWTDSTVELTCSLTSPGGSKAICPPGTPPTAHLNGHQVKTNQVFVFSLQLKTPNTSQLYVITLRLQHGHIFFGPSEQLTINVTSS